MKTKQAEQSEKEEEEEEQSKQIKESNQSVLAKDGGRFPSRWPWLLPVWSADTHREFPQDFKDSASTLALCLLRSPLGLKGEDLRRGILESVFAMAAPTVDLDELAGDDDDDDDDDDDESYEEHGDGDGDGDEDEDDDGDVDKDEKQIKFWRRVRMLRCRLCAGRGLSTRSRCGGYRNNRFDDNDDY